MGQAAAQPALQAQLRAAVQAIGEPVSEQPAAALAAPGELCATIRDWRVLGKWDRLARYSSLLGDFCCLLPLLMGPSYLSQKGPHSMPAVFLCCTYVWPVGSPQLALPCVLHSCCRLSGTIWQPASSRFCWAAGNPCNSGRRGSHW